MHIVFCLQPVSRRQWISARVEEVCVQGQGLLVWRGLFGGDYFVGGGHHLLGTVRRLLLLTDESLVEEILRHHLVPLLPRLLIRHHIISWLLILWSWRVSQLGGVLFEDFGWNLLCFGQSVFRFLLHDKLFIESVDILFAHGLRRYGLWVMLRLLFCAWASRLYILGGSFTGRCLHLGLLVL